MIACADRRLFLLIVELRLPQRIDQWPRHWLGSHRCSVTGTLDSYHAARNFSAPNHPCFGERTPRPSDERISILFRAARLVYCRFRPPPLVIGHIFYDHTTLGTPVLDLDRSYWSAVCFMTRQNSTSSSYAVPFWYWHR